MRKQWRKKMSPAARAAGRRADLAQAHRILTNPKPSELERSYSPRNIAADRAAGRSRKITPAEAAARELKWSTQTRKARETDATPELLRKRRAAGRTVGGRRWTLRKANVTRDPATGMFRRRSQ